MKSYCRILARTPLKKTFNFVASVILDFFEILHLVAGRVPGCLVM